MSWIVVASAVALAACGGGGEGGGEENNGGGEQTAPTLTGTSPGARATGVALDATASFSFSEEMSTDAPALGDGFTVNPPVEGALAWSEDARTLTFTPATGWSAGTGYRVTVSEAASAAGVALAEPIALEFATAAAPAGPSASYARDGLRAEVRISGSADARTYTMTTNAPLRDDLPAGGRTEFSEVAGQPRLRSGHDMFDALFAMAIEETRLASVESISDGAFNNGQGVPCSCFETGEKWNYVWTRDTAYAVDLGLAVVDPERATRSLDFKLSELKSGGGAQVVQDTGSGGSYPVSTDRVVWAIGADQALRYLPDAERAAFATRALEAMGNTIEQDRELVWDARDGLYYGEQSFLDWREQSYPSYTAADTVHLAMSKALSTNVGHYAILRLASRLAGDAGRPDDAARWGGWADDLRAAINDGLWLEEDGLYSTMIATELDPAPIHKYDLLGTSLAVLAGVADGQRAFDTVANYPRVPRGPAVMWPQQPLVRIYHNRGIWPFVTAYGLLAARRVGHEGVFEADLDSLYAGAALNLSHMENFEFLTQLPWVDDGDYSGPVVNSRRQLWSVAGYIGAIVHGVFGVQAEPDALTIAPFVTPNVRRSYFGEVTEVTLHDLKYRGASFTLTLALPAEVGDGGAYAVTGVEVGGQTYDAGAPIPPEAITDGVTIVARLGAPEPTRDDALVVPADDPFTSFWSPREPNLASVQLGGGGLELAFDSAGEEGVVFNVFRDGERIAEGLTTGTYTDAEADPQARSHCYTVEAEFTASGNRSQRARPLCWWGEGTPRVRELGAWRFAPRGGEWSTQHGRPHYQGWGAVGHELEVLVQPRYSGEYDLQAVYGNGAGGINTGITAAVKWARVEDAATGEVVARRPLVMPQLADWSRWGESTFARVTLDASRTYRIVIEDAINMSYFEHFRPYTGGNGGGDGVYNNANINALKLLARTGSPAQRTFDGVAFDGDGDLDAIPPGSRLATGAALQAWSGFGMHWDGENLYVALVSEAFEQDYAPFMIYVQAGSGQLAAPTPVDGVEYSGLQPRLPFVPTHLIAARALSDDGAAGGPYNGVFAYGSGELARASRFEPGVDWWLATDRHTLSMRIPRAMLRGADTLRLAAHVVWAQPDNEWKETVPEGHTPWADGGGAYYEIDLTAAPGAEAWTLVGGQ
jgi:hypothetical protein